MNNLNEYYFVNLFIQDNEKLNNFLLEVNEYNVYNSNKINFDFDVETIEFWQLKNKTALLNSLNNEIQSIIDTLEKFEIEKEVLIKQNFVKTFKEKLVNSLVEVTKTITDKTYLQNMKITISLSELGFITNINDIRVTSPALLNGNVPTEKKQRVNSSKVSFIDRLPLPIKDIDKFSVKYKEQIMEFRYNVEKKLFYTLDNTLQNESYLQMFLKFFNLDPRTTSVNQYATTLVHTKDGRELKLIDAATVIKQQQNMTIKEQILTTQISTIDSDTATIHNENNTKDIDD